MGAAAASPDITLLGQHADLDYVCTNLALGPLGCRMGARSEPPAELDIGGLNPRLCFETGQMTLDHAVPMDDPAALCGALCVDITQKNRRWHMHTTAR